MLVIHLKRFSYTRSHRFHSNSFLTWLCQCLVARRKLHLICLPALSLSLFFSWCSYFRDKLDMEVDFPVTNLDLREFVKRFNPEKPPIYDLHAVSVCCLHLLVGDQTQLHTKCLGLWYVAVHFAHMCHNHTFTVPFWWHGWRTLHCCSYQQQRWKVVQVR